MTSTMPNDEGCATCRYWLTRYEEASARVQAGMSAFSADQKRALKGLQEHRERCEGRVAA